MTKIELLEMLRKNAEALRKDRGVYARNSHMHAIKEAPDQDVIDAVLVNFINYVGAMQGIDYALYTSDFKD
jgi:hypothetical protein